MTDFTGVNCPVCNKPFQPGDDIVVCPECGAPYHRGCYKEVGHCIFEDKHGTADSWQPPKVHTENQSDSVRCPRCGHDNAPGALFCEHCGASISKNDDGEYTQKYAPFGQNGSQQPNSGSVPPFGAAGQQPNGWPYGQVPFVFDPMAGIDPEETIDGEKAGELCKVIQSNTTYYLPVFMNHEKFHKHRFNFAAFLLGGGWLLYRKMYPIGAVVSAVVLVLEVLTQFFTVQYSSQILLQAMNQLGISSTASVNLQQLYQIAGHISSLPASQQFLFLLPNVLPLIILIIHVVIGFTANAKYQKHCIKIVQSIHSETLSDSDTLIRYQERGGVNTILLVVVLVCYLIACNSIYLMI